jgi:hypothetical protein
MKTHVQLNHKVKGELAQEVSRTEQAMALLEDFTIESEADHAFAGEALQAIKAQWSTLEEKRTAVTGPLNEALRTVNDWFRPVQGPLKAAETMLKEKISSYVLARKAANEAAMLAASAAAQAGDGAAAMMHVGSIAEPAKVAGISVKEIWDFEVVNIDEVPMAWLTIDRPKLGLVLSQADKTKTAPAPIPGLRFFLKGQVTARASK